RLGLAVVIIIKGHAVFSPVIHIAQHHPLTVKVGTAVSTPPPGKLDELGQNGRFHPAAWLNLMSYGQNGRSHPTTWLNLMNCEQNGRFHPRHHQIGPISKIGPISAIPTPPLTKLDERGQNGRYHSTVPTNSWRMASGA
ncbi:MAG: hypothetical protein KA773_15940, partial [Chloroflexi bacterium]|nr:hypothetical protein [Chloroflexota bacterium]